VFDVGFSDGVIAHWSDLAKLLGLPILAGLFRAAMETGVVVSGTRICDLRRECITLANAAADNLASPAPNIKGTREWSLKGRSECYEDK
jgi:hypothetical protein